VSSSLSGKSLNRRFVQNAMWLSGAEIALITNLGKKCRNILQFLFLTSLKII